MRKLIWPVLFLLLLLIQGAVSVFFMGWLTFDLPFLALYTFSLLYGENYGAAAGIFAGFLQDSMTTGIFGFHMLTRSILGYLIGLAKDKIFNDRFFYHIISTGCCSLFIRFCFWWVEFMRTGGQWKILHDFLYDTVGYCAGNMLLAYPVAWLVRKIYKWVCAENIEY